MWARCNFKHPHTLPENQECAVAWWLMPRTPDPLGSNRAVSLSKAHLLPKSTPDPEVGRSSPTRDKACFVLEQGHIYSPKVLVIPRKGWLHPNMTEKLFTGTLKFNQSTNQPTFPRIYKYLEVLFLFEAVSSRCLGKVALF